MKNFLPHLLLFFLICFFIDIQLSNGEEKVFLRENFYDLNNWKPLPIKGVDKQSTFEVVVQDGHSLLKTTSNKSASGILLQKRFNVYDFPVVEWVWKVENIYLKGNGRIKRLSDYPIRVYVLFEYNDENKKQISSFTKVLYALLKTFYGEYPPLSALDYVWANKESQKKIFPDPYTSRAMVIPLDMGSADINRWKKHSINILKDYSRAFGGKAPSIATLAIMNDSDNTGESSVSYLNYIEIKK
ncbi:MAG: DUF3047 domain-containing protein [Nitrospinae bacterium]|nr:DUF3047 domain-containing protein [Nitrospinota bacterium]